MIHEVVSDVLAGTLGVTLVEQHVDVLLNNGLVFIDSGHGPIVQQCGGDGYPNFLGLALAETPSPPQLRFRCGTPDGAIAGGYREPTECD